MSIEEFAKISEDNGWGGNPGQTYWPEIEMLYMNTNWTKAQVAYLYWMKTGRFERLVDELKRVTECAKQFQVADGDVHILKKPFELLVKDTEAAYFANTKQGGAK